VLTRFEMILLLLVMISMPISVLSQQEEDENPTEVVTAKVSINVSGLKDQTTEPIQGALVEVFVADAAKPKKDITDQAGFATIDEIPLGRAQIRVRADGWEAEVKKIQLDKQEKRIDITLQGLQPPGNDDDIEADSPET